MRRTLRIDRQMITTVGTPPHFAPTKTTASVRTIPVPSVVLEEIAAHLQAFGLGPDGLVFTNEDDEPIRRNHAGRDLTGCGEAGRGRGALVPRPAPATAPRC